MKTQWGTVALTAILSLSLIGGVAVANENEHMGQSANQPSVNQPMGQPTDQSRQFQPKLEKANELIGAKVINNEGVRLGTVEDIVLTPQRDAISYVALSRGGVLGVGDKLYAIPWSAFELRPQDKTLVLNVNEDYFKTAKSFDKSNWPTAGDQSWLQAVGEHPEHGEYGEQARHEAEESMTTEQPTPQAMERATPTTPSSEGTMPRADIKYSRLTELIGTTIRNPQGTELGELDNVVLDMHQGKVAYGIVSLSSGFLGMNKKLAAVPWSSIEINERQGVALLNADKNTLQAIAFDENNFPNLADVQYSRDLHQRFNARPYWEAFGYVPGEQPRDRDMMSPRTPTSEYPRTPGLGYNEYNKMYNPSEVKTLHGTIESVGLFNIEGPQGTPISAVRLRIRADDGSLVTVHTAPRSYLESRNMWFHHGDEVTVTGSSAKIGWRDVILASQIKKGDQTLDLRSKEGKPLWSMEEPENANR